MATKKNLGEDGTSAKFITPALYQAGWAEAPLAPACEVPDSAGLD